MRVITHADGTFAGYLPDSEPEAAPPHVLTVRKTAQGTVMVGITAGDRSVFIAVADPEVQFELMEVIRDEGPREFVLSY